MTRRSPSGAGGWSARRMNSPDCSRCFSARPTTAGASSTIIPRRQNEAMKTNILNYTPVPRREFLWRFGGGLGGIALAHLLGRHDLLADTVPPKPRAEFNGGLHHRAKVKRIVQLFMNGGASQMDTFDYKAEL